MGSGKNVKKREKEKRCLREYANVSTIGSIYGLNKELRTKGSKIFKMMTNGWESLKDNRVIKTRSTHLGFIFEGAYLLVDSLPLPKVCIDILKKEEK